MKLIVLITTTAIIESDENHPDYINITDPDYKKRQMIRDVRDMWETKMASTLCVSPTEINNVQVFELPEAPTLVSSDDLEKL